MNRRPPREPRYKALAFMSAGCVLAGLSYLLVPRPKGSKALDIAAGILPLWVLAMVWLAVGVSGLLTVLLRRPGNVVFAAQFGLFAMWAASYWIAAILFGYWAGLLLAGWLTVLAGAVAYLTRVEPPLWRADGWLVRVKRPWR